MLPWHQYSRHHFVSFMMYISGAKFENTKKNTIFLYSSFIKSFKRLVTMNTTCK